MSSIPGTATVDHINPEGLAKSPAFTQAVKVTGPATTVYVGGQNGVDADGALVGEDLRSQAARALENLETALAAAGARLEHVVKWTVLAVDGQPLHDGFEEFQRVWGQRPDPPAISVAVVSALAVPGALVEVEAVAVVPDDGGR
jgi:enamine deaminase RidA (YjgF/YER057c/UK114 family)